MIPSSSPLGKFRHHGHGPLFVTSTVCMYDRTPLPMQPLALFLFAEKYTCRCKNGSVYFFSSPGLLEHDFMKKTAREKRWSARVSRLECTWSPRPVDRGRPQCPVSYPDNNSASHLFEVRHRWRTTTLFSGRYALNAEHVHARSLQKLHLFGLAFQARPALCMHVFVKVQCSTLGSTLEDKCFSFFSTDWRWQWWRTSNSAVTAFIAKRPRVAYSCSYVLLDPAIATCGPCC